MNFFTATITQHQLTLMALRGLNCCLFLLYVCVFACVCVWYKKNQERIPLLCGIISKNKCHERGCTCTFISNVKLT